MYLGCAEQELGTVERRKRNNLLQRAVSSPKEWSRARRPRQCGPSGNLRGLVDALRGGLRASPLMSRWSLVQRTEYANLFGEGGERSSLARGGRKNWLGRLLHRPDRLERAGFREDGEARPRRAGNANRTQASENLTRGGRRHRDLREGVNQMIASDGGGNSNAVAIAVRKVNDRVTAAAV